MKFIKLFCLLSVVCSYSYAQQTNSIKEEKIFKLQSQNALKITAIDKSILKLEYPDGKVVYQNIADYIPDAENIAIYSQTFDSTIINLRTIDTSLFHQKYSFWKEIKVGTISIKPPLVTDINNNGKPEIYGTMRDYYNKEIDIMIMEINNQEVFDTVYRYDSTAEARASHDIDKDGMPELFIYRYPPDTNYPGHSWLIFKKPNVVSFPTDLSFIFYPFPENNQLDQNNFGDWDGDEFTDQVFIRSCCHPTVNIYEYNPVINNFDSVYAYDFDAISFYAYGFAIGDINQNGRTEYFLGGVNGDVFAIENCGNNCYEFIWQSKVDTYNAYLYAVTNDLDGNGKPEVWLGGWQFYNGDAITRITIFEASGNNNYVAVGKIDLIGAFNWNAHNMQVLDIDKDGKEEVMMCIDGHIIILKFNGSINHQTYEVFYLKRDVLALSGRYTNFYGATMYDITGDGKEEIIIHMDEIMANVGNRYFTHIYKSDITLDVKEPTHLPEIYNLEQNYPNPFNPTTIIKYQIPESGYVTLKIYDILGKEVATLVNEEKTAGRYEVNFDASNLSSGVYIYQVKINDFVSSRKMVLMK